MSVEIKLITISRDEYRKVIAKNRSPFLILRNNYFRNTPFIELFLTDTEETIVNSILDNSIDDFILDNNLLEVI